jgi:hypothetical protein
MSQTLMPPIAILDATTRSCEERDGIYGAADIAFGGGRCGDRIRGGGRPARALARAGTRDTGAPDVGRMVCRP